MREEKLLDRKNGERSNKKNSHCWFSLISKCHQSSGKIHHREWGMNIATSYLFIGFGFHIKISSFKM